LKLLSVVSSLFSPPSKLSLALGSVARYDPGNGEGRPAVWFWETPPRHGRLHRTLPACPER
jgi:hypothetical protein